MDYDDYKNICHFSRISLTVHGRWFRNNFIDIFIVTDYANLISKHYIKNETKTISRTIERKHIYESKI